MTDAATGDLKLALDLLCVLRAWYRVPVNRNDPGRDNELFPLRQMRGGSAQTAPLWHAVELLLGRYERSDR
ncbi:hypothetical protein AB3X94_37110 [Paraburkholderia sp. BR10923]|uniref:hypothetical protein n=1 Tax=Paraburkholderia sp. BR10923 TaxID=3236992 RepID=UPI0034CF5AE0